VVLDDVMDVAVRLWRLVVPEVCVIFPPTVKLLSVPKDVRELLVMPEPKLVEDTT
jgi:hypothetical protein